MGSKHYKSKSGGKYIFRRALIIVVILAIIAGIVFAVKSCSDKSAGGDQTSSTASGDAVSKVEEPPHVVAKATIGSSGDVLIHNPVWKAAKVGDNYDFSGDFEFAKKYYSKYDYMVMNLEVTFGKSNNYTGYPTFNCPPSLSDTLKDSGVDLLLTANNHTNDTGSDGIINTVQILKSKGLDNIGTRENEEDPIYGVKTVNGIKIATACYTYSTTPSPGRKALNGNIIKQGCENLVATFDYTRLDEFYADAQAALESMKNEGAELSIVYVHWGDEYQYTPNAKQKEMAQALCDMGWDVIIGGHPHVLQPFESLVGKDGNETICLYSMGNAISNQRRELMNSDGNSGHTEDGVIFELEIEKWSDGKIKLTNVNALPTWVNYFNQNGKTLYRIVVLDPTVSDWSTLGITRMNDAKKSYERTMKIVGEPLNIYRTLHSMDEVPLTVQ